MVVAIVAASVITMVSADAASAKRVVRLGGGTTLTLGSGVKAKVLRSVRAGALPAGEQEAGRAFSLRFRGGRSSFVGQLRVRLPREARGLNVRDVRGLYRLRLWTGKRRGWQRLPARFSADRRYLTAQVWRGSTRLSARASQLRAPLSIVSGGRATFQTTQQIDQAIDWLFEDFVKGRSSESPQCGSGPPWVQASGLTLDRWNPIVGCLRSEGDLAVVELVNNRPFGVVLRYGHQVEFGWADQGVGLPALYRKIQQEGAADGLYIPAQKRAAIGVKPFEGATGSFRSQPTPLSMVLDFILDTADVGSDKLLEVSSDKRCAGALGKLVFEDASDDLGALVTAAAVQAVDCLPATAAMVLRNIRDAGSTRAAHWKIIKQVADHASAALLAIPLGYKWSAILVDKASGGALAEFKLEGHTVAKPQPTPQPQPAPQSQPIPQPAPPKPYAGNLRAYAHGPGHVGVAFDVGWQEGRDPVICHFFRDRIEVFTAQCGTSSSKQFYGVPAGTHSWHATVSDRFGVYSDPTNIVTLHNG